MPWTCTQVLRPLFDGPVLRLRVASVEVSIIRALIEVSAVDGAVDRLRRPDRPGAVQRRIQRQGLRGEGMDCCRRLSAERLRLGLPDAYRDVQLLMGENPFAASQPNHGESGCGF